MEYSYSTELPTGEVVDVIFAPNAVSYCNTCLRPVGAIFNKKGHLIVAADATSEIYKITYRNSSAGLFVSFNVFVFAVLLSFGFLM